MDDITPPILSQNLPPQPTPPSDPVQSSAEVAPKPPVTVPSVDPSTPELLGTLGGPVAAPLIETHRGPSPIPGMPAADPSTTQVHNVDTPWAQRRVYLWLLLFVGVIFLFLLIFVYVTQV